MIAEVILFVGIAVVIGILFRFVHNINKITPRLVKVKLKHGEDFWLFEDQIPLLEERGLIKEMCKNDKEV